MLRCPACRSRHFTMFEIFEAYDAILVRDGKAVERVPGSGGATGEFSAECDCGHRWSPRYKTGIRAVNAVIDIETKEPKT